MDLCNVACATLFSSLLGVVVVKSLFPDLKIVGTVDEAPTVNLKWEVVATGRLFFILSRDMSQEPRLLVREDFTSAQVFGVNVQNAHGCLLPHSDAVGFPYSTFQEIMAGTVSAQAVFLPYEKYERSDGHTLWLPRFDAFTYSHDMDDYGWAKNDFNFGSNAPFNSVGVLYSTPLILTWPLTRSLTIELNRIEPPKPPNPQETEYMKFISLRSGLLSHFWGRDVNISAWVLLPAEFHERPQARYPVVINHGHYSHDAFRGWSDSRPEHVIPPRPSTLNPDDCYYCSTTGCEDCKLDDSFDQLYAYFFARNWTQEQAAFHKYRVLLVRMQTPNPFFDDSYAINSANLGPYGDALTFELLPEIEHRFRGLGPWARGMYGGSTGGWESLAAQVLYPTEYNGCIANAPDPVDFRALQTLNIYSEQNAFYPNTQFPIGMRPFRRNYKGQIGMTMELQMLYERALGGSVSGRQLHGWFAVFGPKGPDGYPKPLWDDRGHIDKSVAAFWKENYDLSDILNKSWEYGLGSKLQGKIKVNVGLMDNFALNDAVYLLETMLKNRKPNPMAEFRYGTANGRGYSHAWSGSNETSMRVVDLTLHQRMIPILVKGFLQRAPSGADTESWRY